MFTVNEVADQILKLSKSKVYELVEQGKLGHHRFDGAIRISQKHIDDYLAQTENEPHEVAAPLGGSPRLRRLRL